MQTSLGRPIKMLGTEPVLVAFTVWISFTWGELTGGIVVLAFTDLWLPGVLYILLVAVPLVFANVFHFK